MNDYPNTANSTQGQAEAKYQVSLGSRNPTVAQNIDNHIASLQEQIARLEAVKTKLSANSILDVSLTDLQMAMGRY